MSIFSTYEFDVKILDHVLMSNVENCIVTLKGLNAGHYSSTQTSSITLISLLIQKIWN